MSEVMWSRHMVVCCVAQENVVRANGVSALTGITKSRFSCIYSSMMPYPNDTKFTGEATFKIWTRSLSHSRDMSWQNFINIHFFLLFAHFAKIPISRACELQSCWNLVTYWEYKGEYQYWFCGKSGQYSRNYKWYQSRASVKPTG